jgi:glycosyltransferase involved in cell wall biosynthesis
LDGKIRKEIKMAELSVIIPFCNEYPQILFTIQSIAQELRDRVDFEIIAVNNYCDEVEKQGRKEIKDMNQ